MRDFKKNIKKAGRCALFFLILISLFLGMQGYMISASKRDETLVHARNKNLVGIKKERAECSGRQSELYFGFTYAVMEGLPCDLIYMRAGRSENTGDILYIKDGA